MYRTLQGKVENKGGNQELYVGKAPKIYVGDFDTSLLYEVNKFSLIVRYICQR